MSSLSSQLRNFERRVRLVRAWRGFAIGACVGAGSSAVWAILDLRSIAYTEWAWMGALTAAAALIGGAVGVLLRIPTSQLVESIDRRAGLEDRLTTARERFEGNDPFDDALRFDAEEKLGEVKPNAVYPIRFGRWHGGAIVLGALSAAIFVLGNTPIILSEQAKKDREDLKKEGQTVERVTKENFETPEAKQEMSDAERKLANQLRQFDRDLEKAHMSKEEALQKSNDLAQQASDLMQQAEKASQQSLGEAQTAREQLEKSEVEKAGIENATPQMAQMPEGERQQRMDQAKREAKRIESELDALKRQLEEIKRKLSGNNLSPAERKVLEQQQKDLQKKIDALKNEQKANEALQKALELSKEAMAVFQKMMQDPLYKQMIELEKKLAQNSAAASRSGQPQLTDAERKEMKEQLERLAAMLKDDKAMKAYLAAMLEALKRANQLGRCAGILPGLGMLPMGGNSMEQAPAGPGAPTEDVWMGDTGHIHKLDKATASQGKTTMQVISGDQRAATGPQAYVEIKAPSTVGNRSSVPYKDVLPSYEKKAESALSRQQIPKEHQKRVKDYFDSLTGAGKN